MEKSHEPNTVCHPWPFVVHEPGIGTDGAFAGKIRASCDGIYNQGGVLRGRWVRIQGGYVITINSVDADGRLDASYANPRPLPFHTSVATSDGNSVKLFFELRAAGYNGSTYALSYDAANDRLTGVYDQVVVKQKFEVVFVRSKS